MFTPTNEITTILLFEFHLVHKLPSPSTFTFKPTFYISPFPLPTLIKETIKPFVFISILFNNYLQHSPSLSTFHSFHLLSLLRKQPTFSFLFLDGPFIALGFSSRHYEGDHSPFCCPVYPVLPFTLVFCCSIWRRSLARKLYLHLTCQLPFPFTFKILPQRWNDETMKPWMMKPPIDEWWNQRWNLRMMKPTMKPPILP